MDMINTLQGAGIVPVIVIEDEKKAVPLARALVAGGLPVIEITFRTAAAAGEQQRQRQDQRKGQPDPLALQTAAIP